MSLWSDMEDKNGKLTPSQGDKQKKMKPTFIIGNETADSYFPGYEITCFFKYPADDSPHVNLEFTQEDSDEKRHIWLECEETSIDVVYNRVCDALINHPHVIDLRGLAVTIQHG